MLSLTLKAWRLTLGLCRLTLDVEADPGAMEADQVAVVLTLKPWRLAMVPMGHHGAMKAPLGAIEVDSRAVEALT